MNNTQAEVSNVAQNSEQDLDLMKYWLMFRRNWLIIFGFGLTGLLIASWNVSKITPLYRASVQVVVDPTRSASPGAQDYSYYYAQRLFYQTQETVLGSRLISELAANKLTKEEKERLLPTKPIIEKTESFFSKTKSQLKGLIADSTKPQKKTTSTVSINIKSEIDSRYTPWGGVIQGSKRIVGNKDTQILSIGFVSPDPKLAARISNILAETYIEYTQESRANLTERTGQWMAGQVERLRDSLRESEDKLLKFQLEEGLLNLGEVQSLASEQLKSANVSVNEAQSTVDELSKRYGPKHPKLIQAKGELEAARRKLNNASQSILLDTGKQLQLSKLENELKSNREIYDLFLSRFKRMDISANTDISPIYSLDEAVAPGAPFAPNVKRTSMIGLFIGLFFGFALVWLKDRLDKTIHNPKQLEHETGIPSLGAIPVLGRDDKRIDARMRRKTKHKNVGEFERFYSHNPKSSFAESINHVRTSVLFSRAEQSPKTLLITSAVQSEGKTTLATNLALAFSQQGKTLLIDADLRKPRIHHMTNHTSSHGGIVECLVGKVSVESVIIPDELIPTLSILKSGVIPPNPQELLSSRKFKDLLEGLKEQFDYIVVDCAPVLPVSDALVVSPLVDGIILLAEANATAKDLIHEANNRLKSVNAPLLGAVLTQFDHKKNVYYGGYQRYSSYYTYSYK